MNLTINVSKEFDCYTLSLTPSMKRKLITEFEGIEPVNRISISCDSDVNFKLLEERIEKYLMPILTGIYLKPEYLYKIENLEYKFTN